MPDVCPRCNRRVFTAEQKIALGRVWHTFCYSCYKCRRLLGTSEVYTVNEELLCSKCHDHLYNSCQTLSNSGSDLSSNTSSIDEDENLSRAADCKPQNQKDLQRKPVNYHSIQVELQKLNLPYQEHTSKKKCSFDQEYNSIQEELRNLHLLLEKPEESNLNYQESKPPNESNHLYQDSGIPQGSEIHHFTQLESKTLSLSRPLNSSDFLYEKRESRSQCSLQLRSEENKHLNQERTCCKKSDSSYQKLDDSERRSCQHFSQLKPEGHNIPHEVYTALKIDNYPCQDCDWSNRKAVNQYSPQLKSEETSLACCRLETLNKSHTAYEESDCPNRKSNHSCQLKSEDPAELLRQEYESLKRCDLCSKGSNCPKRKSRNQPSQLRSKEVTLPHQKSSCPEANYFLCGKCEIVHISESKEHNVSKRKVKSQQKINQNKSLSHSQNYSPSKFNILAVVDDKNLQVDLEENCGCVSSTLPMLHTIPSPTAVTAWYSRQHTPKKIQHTYCCNATVESEKPKKPSRFQCSSDQGVSSQAQLGAVALRGKGRSLSNEETQHHNSPRFSKTVTGSGTLNYDYFNGLGEDNMTSSGYGSGNECRFPLTKLGGGYICRRCGRKVYHAEMILASGFAFHTCCFSCATCRKPLEATTVWENQGEIYCKLCSIRQFGPTGYGYGLGAGTLQTL